MDGGAWWAAVHGVPKSQTRLSDFTLTFHFHALEKETAAHSSALAWRVPGTGSLVGCRLWGRTGSDTTEATQPQQQHPYILVLAMIAIKPFLPHPLATDFMNMKVRQFPCVHPVKRL